MSEERKCGNCGIDINLEELHVCGCWVVEGEAKFTPTSEGVLTYNGDKPYVGRVSVGTSAQQVAYDETYLATEAEHKVLANTLRELRLRKDNPY